MLPPVVQAALLAAGVAGALAPRRLPRWLLPVVLAVLGIAAGAIHAEAAVDALDPLLAPLAFVVLAVPLALAVDRTGFFEAVAERVERSPHPAAACWCIGIAAVALLNLDAAVVLLVPLTVRTARRVGVAPLVLVIQPALLACLASSLLPVSNLTNLTAQGIYGVDAVDVLRNLGLPTLVAVAVGWWRYRRAYDVRPTVMLPPAGRGDDRLVAGSFAVVGFAVGLLVGPSVGIPPWVVAGVALALLSIGERRVPWRNVPLGAALLVAALAVLATACVAALQPGTLPPNGSTADLVGVAGGAALASNAANNLPVALAGFSLLPHAGTTLWALLLGVNAGAIVIATGSLSTILWLDLSHRLGVDAHPRDFTRAGIRVGLPAFGAALAALLALDATGLLTRR